MSDKQFINCFVFRVCKSFAIECIFAFFFCNTNFFLGLFHVSRTNFLVWKFAFLHLYLLWKQSCFPIHYRILENLLNVFPLNLLKFRLESSALALLIFGEKFPLCLEVFLISVSVSTIFLV